MNVIKTVSFLLNAPLDLSIILKGNHGIGKSQIVRLAVNKMRHRFQGEQVGYEDRRLSQDDVGDLKGLPFNVGGRTYFAPPSWLPIHPEDAKILTANLKKANVDFIQFNTAPRGILFLDEFNHARKEVQHAAFELVLDRRLNGIRIPDGWRVVAAVNDNSDIYDGQDMSPALKDRFFHIDFKPTDAEFFDYATSGKKFTIEGFESPIIHDAVIQFLRQKPEKMDAKDAEIEASNATGARVQSRRSWEKLSDVIVQYERLSLTDPEVPNLLDGKNEDDLILIAQGLIGSGLAVDFANFVRLKYKVLNPKKVLNSWSKEIEEHVSAISLVEAADFVTNLLGELELIAKTKKTLTAKQKEGLNNFLRTAYEAKVRDPLGDFWATFSKGTTRAMALDWYGGPGENDESKKILVDCTQRPKSVK